MTAHKRRRRRIGFLDFMNEIAAAYPDTAIHVVLDNLNTHKPKNDRWLKRHPNVHFHFTPTRASWLNQVEIWFSILQGNSLKDASFTSVKLRDNGAGIDVGTEVEEHFEDARRTRAEPWPGATRRFLVSSLSLSLPTKAFPNVISPLQSKHPPGRIGRRF
jgi:transposase